MEKVDSQGMHKVYDAWPSIASDSVNTGHSKVDFHNISHIVFSGMGGSGAIHDILAAILSKTNVHVSIVKGYHLPKTADSETLVVTTSVSGETIETLSVLDSAKKINCKIIAFSDGGQMEDYCLRNKIEHRHIPQHHSPRSSLPSYLFSMLDVLEPVIPIKKNDVIESINDLKNLQKNISSSNLISENPAIELASWITNIPIIYYPWGLQAAAVRFKNSLQENAKMHVIMEDVIEAGHNGIVAWEKNPTPKPILIRGHDDYEKTKERWDIMKEFFEQKQINYKEIFSNNGCILSKLMNLIYFLDYTTIYRSVLSGIDPTPVTSIDFIKSRTK